MPQIYLPHHLKASLQRGHPWIYRNQCGESPRLPDGSWVLLQCGDHSAYGLWDNSGPIAVRVFSRQRKPDADWLAEKVETAWQLREPVRAQDTTAYRWLNGEGDGIPGVVVDLYMDFAVVSYYAGSLEVVLPWLLPALRQKIRLRGILGRSPEDSREPFALWGRLPPRDLIVHEHGMKMHVNLLAGQKTGLYLDQRENRLFIERLSHGKKVLNCFAYTGGFSLFALRGGAIETINCDIAGAATEESRRNFALNGFEPKDHEFITGDAFELLESSRRQGRRFDLVILDPPSFARARKSRHAALRAYTRLNSLALGCVVEGGYLATASCTAQVSPEMFREMLGEASRQAGRQLTTIHEAGQAMDHPIPAGFPEGRYLKFVVGQVTSWS